MRRMDGQTYIILKERGDTKMYHIYSDGQDVCQTRDEEIAKSVVKLLENRAGVEFSWYKWEVEL